MRRGAHCLALLVILSVASLCAAGDIQVLCEPGLKVLVDGQQVGTSNARDDGLFLEGVEPGVHTLRVEKDGFLPQTFHLEISSLPIEVRVKEFVAEPAKPVETPAPHATVAQDPGRIRVTSAPQNCTVEVDGSSEEKTSPQLTLDDIAPGEHTITFRKQGYAPISSPITVFPGTELTVRGDLRSGTVDLGLPGKGKLRVMSKPERCEVRFAGQTWQKTDRLLKVSKLPAGKHHLVVSIPGRELATDVVIMDGRQTTVRVSFIAGEEPFVVTHEGG